MTSFVDFCRAHGLIIDSMPPIGKWARYRTEDKPRNRNGSVKWLGDTGLCMNWATMAEPAMWKSNSSNVAAKPLRSILNDSRRQADRLALKAAKKAAHILSECELKPHPYLEKKGFPDAVVNVWNDETAVIPMRTKGQLVGCQLIGPDGAKKFLYGQRSGGAEFVIGRHGRHIICEGYATALSLQNVLRNMKKPCVIHVAFSAGNMKRIAQALPNGFVLADNDASGTGERVANEIGWPYWMSDVVGEDFNDAHMRLGVFPLSMQLMEVFKK